MSGVDDNGVKSRKLWFSAGTSLLIALAALFVPAALFAEVVMGLVSICAIYVGGNTATRWVNGKHSVATAKVNAKTDAPKSVPTPAKK